MSLDDLRRQQEVSERHASRVARVNQQIGNFYDSDLPQIIKLALDQLARAGVRSTSDARHRIYLPETTIEFVTVSSSFPYPSTVRLGVVGDTVQWSGECRSHHKEHYYVAYVSPVEPLVILLLVILHQQGEEHPRLRIPYLWKGPEDNQKIANALVASAGGRAIRGDLKATYRREEMERKSKAIGNAIGAFLGWVIIIAALIWIYYFKGCS